MARSHTPPARRRAPRLPPEERRAQLVASAVRVLARRGLGGASHTDVAREAGVSVPAVFVYFATREDLVSAVIDDVARLYLGMADRSLGTQAPVPEALLAFARNFAESVDEQADHARVWLDWSTAIRDELWPRYLEFQERVVSVLAGVIRRGQREGSVARSVQPEDAARLFVGAAYVVSQMKFTHRSGAQLERLLHSLVRATVGGAESAPGRGRRDRSGARKHPARRRE